MQTKDTAKKLSEAIEEAQLKLAAKGPFTAVDIARSVIDALEGDPDWPTVRDELVLGIVTVAAQRRITRTIASSDPRQGWLALPEYEHVPQLIEVGGGFMDVNEVTLEQYRESEAQLRLRIRSYGYPRRSEEKLKRDRQALAQMRRLERSVAPLMAGDPLMKMRDAIAAFEQLGGHLLASRKARGSKAIRARWNRKNP